LLYVYAIRFNSQVRVALEGLLQLANDSMPPLQLIISRLTYTTPYWTMLRLAFRRGIREWVRFRRRKERSRGRKERKRGGKERRWLRTPQRIWWHELVVAARTRTLIRRNCSMHYLQLANEEEWVARPCDCAYCALKINRKSSHPDDLWDFFFFRVLGTQSWKWKSCCQENDCSRNRLTTK